MRFILTAAPDPNRSKPEAEAPPDDKLIADYMRFNEEMHKAGVLVTAEGVNPGAKGARVGISKGKRKVLDGPFIETKELVGGFYLIDVKSLDEAIEWAMRCPVGLGTDDILTIYPMTGAEDIPPELLKLIQEVAPTWSATWSATVTTPE